MEREAGSIEAAAQGPCDWEAGIRPSCTPDDRCGKCLARELKPVLRQLRAVATAARDYLEQEVIDDWTIAGPGTALHPLADALREAGFTWATREPTT